MWMAEQTLKCDYKQLKVTQKKDEKMWRIMNAQVMKGVSILKKTHVGDRTWAKRDGKELKFI